MADEPDILAARITAALQPGIPNYYVNGFASALGTGDVIVSLERNGAPVASINMSFTIAKTLALSLSQVIGNLEAMTSRTMLTTHEMEQALSSGEDVKK